MSTLRDADLSLGNWLERVLPPDTGVRFDAPRADWEQGQRRSGSGHGSGTKSGSGLGSGPESGSAFVGVFLCGIRKDDQSLPHAGWSDVRGLDGQLVGRQSAPRYYRLTYLVTPWADAVGGDGEPSRRTIAEHELLGTLIDACADADTLADDDLTGALAEAGIPCYLRCAEGDAGRSVESLWSGFGIAPHAYLVLDLVVPVVPPVVTELAPPAREIVLDAAQDPDSRTGTPAAGPAPAAARPVGTTSGTVRRWERSTIIERGAAAVRPVQPARPGEPGRTPRAQD